MTQQFFTRLFCEKIQKFVIPYFLHHLLEYHNLSIAAQYLHLTTRLDIFIGCPPFGAAIPSTGSHVDWKHTVLAGSSQARLPGY